MRFVRDIDYVIYLEHDGGLRFKTKPTEVIHQGERKKIETPDKKTEVGH